MRGFGAWTEVQLGWLMGGIKTAFHPDMDEPLTNESPAIPLDLELFLLGLNQYLSNGSTFLFLEDYYYLTRAKTQKGKFIQTLYSPDELSSTLITYIFYLSFHFRNSPPVRVSELCSR